MVHTPGPWEARKLLCDGHMVNKTGWEIHTPGYDVCTLVFVGAPIRKEADARLIAAAPDLLAALHDARLVLATIAKEKYQGDDWAERDESIVACLLGIDTAIAKAKGEE